MIASCDWIGLIWVARPRRLLRCGVLCTNAHTYMQNKTTTITPIAPPTHTHLEAVRVARERVLIEPLRLVEVPHRVVRGGGGAGDPVRAREELVDDLQPAQRLGRVLELEARGREEGVARPVRRQAQRRERLEVAAERLERLRFVLLCFVRFCVLERVCMCCLSAFLVVCMLLINHCSSACSPLTHTPSHTYKHSKATPRGARIPATRPSGRGTARPSARAARAPRRCGRGRWRQVPAGRGRRGR